MNKRNIDRFTDTSGITFEKNYSNEDIIVNKLFNIEEVDLDDNFDDILDDGEDFDEEVI